LANPQHIGLANMCCVNAKLVPYKAICEKWGSGRVSFGKSARRGKMDKCEGCPMNMHLDFPEAGGCGRIDCYLIPSDFTAIKAAIAGEGRLVLRGVCGQCWAFGDAGKCGDPDSGRDYVKADELGCEIFEARPRR